MLNIFLKRHEKFLIENARKFSNYIELNSHKALIEIMTAGISGIQFLAAFEGGRTGVDGANFFNVLHCTNFAFRCAEEIDTLSRRDFGVKSLTVLKDSFIEVEQRICRGAGISGEAKAALTVQNAIAKRMALTNAEIELDPVGNLRKQFDLYYSSVFASLGVAILVAERKELIDLLFSALTPFPTIYKVIGDQGLLGGR
jgi:hypothetical protein